MTTIMDLIDGGGTCMEVGPDPFFMEKSNQWNKEGKRVCTGCPVLAECREWAIPQPDLYGTWGGTTQEERGEIRAGRAA